MGQERPPGAQAPDERELERGYAADDEAAASEALTVLLGRHEKALVFQARRQCGGNRDLEEEALGELKLELWEKRKEYDVQHPWISWARLLLNHIVVGLLRKKGRESGQPPPGPATADPQPPPIKKKPAMLPEPEDGMDREDQALTHRERKESTEQARKRMQAVRECLQVLRSEGGERLFRAYILRKWTKLGFAAMAKRLGLSTAQVWKTYQKAEAFMKKCLEQELGGER